MKYSKYRKPAGRKRFPLKGTRRPRRGKSKRGRKFLFFLVGIILLFFSLSRLSIRSVFSPLSVFSQIVNPGGLKKTDGRTNILVMGLDRRSEEFAGLTDTMIVASISRDKTGAGAVLISLPRDLWVSLGDGSYAKINAAYSAGGINLARDVVESVTGIPIHYSIVVDFEGFKKAIDILGGIEVDVEREFDDYYYPIPGMEAATCGMGEEDPLEEASLGEGELSQKEVFDSAAEGPGLGDINKSENEDTGENMEVVEVDLVKMENEQYDYPCRFEHLRFDKGLQLMDGETALKYARSRHGTNNEGTDFARSARQHKVIFSIKDRIVSTNFISDIGKIKELYETYKGYVETDLGLSEIERLYTELKDIKSQGITTVVLDNESGINNGGLLFTPRDRTLYGGAYVLLPKAGDFTQINAFVQKLLFGE